MKLKRILWRVSVALAITLPSIHSTMSVNAEVRPAHLNVSRSPGVDDIKDLVLSAPIWEVKKVWRSVPVTFRQWRCDYVPAPGTSWFDDYLNLPVSLKVPALMNALEGITYEQAVIIVRRSSGYFVSRPASWNSFVEEAWRAEENLREAYPEMRDFFWNVAVVHGESNFRNLRYHYPNYAVNNLRDGVDYNDDEAPPSRRNPGDGNYNDDDSPVPAPRPQDGDYNDGDSGPQPVPAPVPVPAPAPTLSYDCRWVSETRYFTRLVDESVPTGQSLTKVVDIFFEGSFFLNGEKELISLTWDGGDRSRVVVDTSRALHNYSEFKSADGGIFRLIAESRRAIAPYLSDFNVSFSGGQLVVTDRRYEELKSLGEDPQLVVSFNINIKAKSGGCGGKTTNQGAKANSVRAGTVAFNVLEGMETPKSGEQVLVTDLQISRRDTKYFDHSAVLYPNDLSMKFAK